MVPIRHVAADGLGYGDEVREGYRMVLDLGTVLVHKGGETFAEINLAWHNARRVLVLRQYIENFFLVAENHFPVRREI